MAGSKFLCCIEIMNIHVTVNYLCMSILSVATSIQYSLHLLKTQTDTNAAYRKLMNTATLQVLFTLYDFFPGIWFMFGEFLYIYSMFNSKIQERCINVCYFSFEYHSICTQCAIRAYMHVLVQRIYIWKLHYARTYNTRTVKSKKRTKNEN